MEMTSIEFWNTAAEMDRVADQRAAAWNKEHPDSGAQGEQTYDVVSTRDFANSSRVAALLATVDSTIQTMDGWLLAPHPLMVRCSRTTISVTDQSARDFVAPVSDLTGTAAAMLSLAVDAAQACASTSGSCGECDKWAASISA